MLSSKNIKKAIGELSRRGFKDKDISLESILPSLYRILGRVREDEIRQNTLKIVVANKEEISSKTVLAIKEKMNAQEAPSEITEDPDLCAGFLAEYKGFLFDCSAKNQLKKMKETFNRK